MIDGAFSMRRATKLFFGVVSILSKTVSKAGEPFMKIVLCGAISSVLPLICKRKKSSLGYKKKRIKKMNEVCCRKLASKGGPLKNEELDKSSRNAKSTERIDSFSRLLLLFEL